MRLDLLTMRYLILLVAGAALAYLGWDNGIIPTTLAKDTSYISEGIIALFGIGVVLCGYRVIECSNAINATKKGHKAIRFRWQSHYFQVQCERRQAPVAMIAHILPYGGLLGTVYGFIQALGGTSFANLTSSATAGAEIGHMIADMHIALVTTLVGVTTYIFLTLCLRVLEGGYQLLYGLRVKEGGNVQASN